MTKNEFMKRIEMAHERLDESYSQHGCCDSLWLNSEVYYMFSNMLRPRYLSGDSAKGIEGKLSYWLGNLTKENLPLRHHFIDMFAGIILADKGYKDLENYYINKGWLK